MPGEIVSLADAIGVATGAGVLALREVQPEGRTRVAAREFASGQRLCVGQRFDPPPSDGSEVA